MEQVTIYEKFRLIEKSEPEVNGVWKVCMSTSLSVPIIKKNRVIKIGSLNQIKFDESNCPFICITIESKTFIFLKDHTTHRKPPLEDNKGVHLLLFFLAFVFGSFCTFCFHMLMYLFDEKCVLFPKLLSLTSVRQNIIYEFVPEDKDAAEMLPVDFISTQWVEKSACLLPTYVPLVSGIFGLVWTTIFLMCSTGSRVLTGLQRPWRILPPVFIFSCAMSILCFYTSAVTHYGLQELCLKLSEFTGSTTCTYTINVATLAYERRIRGVYQATRLTILSAWLHTACWVLSAMLSLLRVLLAVDFKLVRISVRLQGNVDRMLEQHEKQIRTVWPVTLESNSTPSNHSPNRLQHTHLKIHKYQSNLLGVENNTISNIGHIIYVSSNSSEISEPSLVPVERNKLDKLAAYENVSKEHQFIVKMLYNIVDTVEGTTSVDINSTSSSTSTLSDSALTIVRQYGQQKVGYSHEGKSKDSLKEVSHIDLEEAEKIAMNIRRRLKTELFESTMNITSDMKLVFERNNARAIHLEDYSKPSTSKEGREKDFKSNLRQKGVQTEDKLRDKSLKVKIDSKKSFFNSQTLVQNVDNEPPKSDKETQTNKEKQE